MRRIISSVVGIGVVLMAVTAVSAQSLADLAKRDNDRRKSVKHPAKVITNDDVQDVKPIVPMTADAEAANAAAAAANPNAAPAATFNSDRPDEPMPGPAPANGQANGQAAAADKDKAKAGAPGVKAGEEAGWRARMQAARDAVSRTQLQLDSMRSRASQYTAASAAASDDQRAGVQQKQQEALQEYDRLRADLQRSQKALTDLQTEASKAGVPPGWVR